MTERAQTTITSSHKSHLQSTFYISRTYNLYTNIMLRSIPPSDHMLVSSLNTRPIPTTPEYPWPAVIGSLQKLQYIRNLTHRRPCLGDKSLKMFWLCSPLSSTLPHPQLGNSFATAVCFGNERKGTMKSLDMRAVKEKRQLVSLCKKGECVP